MWDLFTLRSRAMVLPMPWYQICPRLSVTKTLHWAGVCFCPQLSTTSFLMDSEIYRHEMNSLSTIRVRHQFRIFTKKRFDVRFYTSIQEEAHWGLIDRDIYVLKITLETIMQKNRGQFWSKKIIMSDASAQDCGNSMANALELLVICKVINIQHGSVTFTVCWTTLSM